MDDELGVHFAAVDAAALPTHLTAELLYLQHLHHLSDEMALEQWLELPFSSSEYQPF